MAVNPNYTNVNEVTTFYAGGGGGGGGGPTVVASTVTTQALSVSTISGNPQFIGSAFYLTQPNSINDGISFVANPPSPNSGVQPSTIGMRLDMAGQVGYFLMNPTGGVGAGNGLQINANGITLGSPLGVEINNVGGAGAGSLAVSSLSVSSINGATPGGGGGGVTNTAVQLSTNTYFGPPDGVIPLGSFPTTVGHLYNCFMVLDTVSTFSNPVAADRITIIDPTASVVYDQDLPWWASTMVHNPRGDSVAFSFKAGATTSQVSVYANGQAPSTFLGLGNSGYLFVTDLGTV